VADRDDRSQEATDPRHHREITNTAGDFGFDDKPAPKGKGGDQEESGPERAGLKEGDDAWHNRSNRSGERGDNAVPGLGGNTAR
jgi:hypothetical protein